jgi:chromosome segregation ATPase
MSKAKAASKQKSSSTLQQKIEAATKHVREADHRQNLLEARARGAKASVKAAKKALKLLKKSVRKAAKAARKAHKQLRSLVKKANKKPAKGKVPAKPIRKKVVRKPAAVAAKRVTVPPPAPAPMTPRAPKNSSVKLGN